MARHKIVVGILLASTVFLTDAIGLPPFANAADKVMASFKKATLKRQHEAAAELLLASAEAGDAESQFQLGILYRLGVGVAADHEAAIDWLSRAAGNKHRRAKAVLARLKGTVETPKDLTESNAPALRGTTAYTPSVEADARNGADLTWLMRAAARGQLAKLPTLLKPGPTINAATKAAITAP